MLVIHLAELGTLHKAAKQLHISQPAASAMLSDLESLLGCPLFERSRRGVAITPQGRVVQESAQTILNEFAEFSATVGRLAEGRERSLRVGVVPHAFAAYLPRAIESFRAAGGCALKTQEGTARQLLDGLLEGRLDCVIGRLPGEGLTDGHDISALDFFNLYDEDICIVVGADDITKQQPSYADLASRQWVLQRRDSSVRRALTETFLRQGVTPPEPVVETTNYVQSLSLIGKSGFCTVAPRRAAEIQQQLGVVKILPLPLGIAPMKVSFINRKSNANSTVRLFRDCFVAVVKENLSEPQKAGKEKSHVIKRD